MYKCQVCTQTSNPGQARLLHVIHRVVPRIGGGTREEIAAEVPVCRDCQAALDRGDDLRELSRRARQRTRDVTPRLHTKVFATSGPPPVSILQSVLAAPKAVKLFGRTVVAAKRCPNCGLAMTSRDGTTNLPKCDACG